MEATINELKEQLFEEQETCKRLQDDLSSYTERESKLSQSMTSVSVHFFQYFIFRGSLISSLASLNF